MSPVFPPPAPFNNNQPSHFPGPPGPTRDKRPGPGVSKHPNIFNQLSRPLHHSVQTPHKHQNIIVRDTDISDIETGPGGEKDFLEYPTDLGDYQDQGLSFDYYGECRGHFTLNHFNYLSQTTTQEGRLTSISPLLTVPSTSTMTGPGLLSDTEARSSTEVTGEVTGEVSNSIRIPV